MRGFLMEVSPLLPWLVIAVVLILAGWLWRRLFSRHARMWRRARRLYGRLRRGELGCDGRTLTYLRNIDPFLFEELVLFAFRKCGYRITRNRRYTGDGGVDGRMSKGGRRYFLQMKRYSGYIQASHVRDFASLCSAGGRIGVFVHTGKTGAGSREDALSSGNVAIVSGGRLLDLLCAGRDVL